MSIAQQPHIQYFNAIVFVGTLLSGPLYLALSIVALFSTISPTLNSLASHGKTRLLDGTLERGDNDGRRDDLKTSSSLTSPFASHSENEGTYRSAGTFIRFCVKFEQFTVNKSRFIDFYKVGIFTTLIIFYIAVKDVNHEKTAQCEENDNVIGAEHFYHNTWMQLEHLSPWILLLIHLSRRYYECKFVQKSKKSSQMHFLGYLLGLVHYSFLPFVFGNISSGIFQNSLRMSDERLAFVVHISENNRFLSRWRIPGIITSCVYFQYQQYRHHVLLACLRSSDENETDTNRKNPFDAKKSDTYKIPTDGWFNLVTCPHYFSEIMIYSCFVLSLELTNYNNFEQDPVEANDVAVIIQSFTTYAPILNVFKSDSIINAIIAIYMIRHWILLFWVATNLSISARKSHEWYVVRFGKDYPSSRRRLIPFLW